jgi:hypothetical protein
MLRMIYHMRLCHSMDFFFHAYRAWFVRERVTKPHHPTSKRNDTKAHTHTHTHKHTHLRMNKNWHTFWVGMRLTVAVGAALISSASRVASALAVVDFATISTRDGCMYAKATPATMATESTPATTADLRVCCTSDITGYEYDESRQPGRAQGRRQSW